MNLDERYKDGFWLKSPKLKFIGGTRNPVEPVQLCRLGMSVQ